ncbi:MAG: Chagasin family peptidase inhibitor [Bacteroidota bacterium]|nr:Chagasin family peptidase inhibitor [Bacteroidota bacterium]
MNSITIPLLNLFLLFSIPVFSHSHNDTITFKKDSVFVIKLTASIAEGYSWEVTGIDTTCLKIVAKSEKNMDGQKIGGNGLQLFSILGSKRGVCKLELTYWKPWLREKSLKKLSKAYTITIY